MIYSFKKFLVCWNFKFKRKNIENFEGIQDKRWKSCFFDGKICSLNEKIYYFKWGNFTFLVEHHFLLKFWVNFYQPPFCYTIFSVFFGKIPNCSAMKQIEHLPNCGFISTCIYSLENQFWFLQTWRKCLIPRKFLFVNLDFNKTP